MTKPTDKEIERIVKKYTYDLSLHELFRLELESLVALAERQGMKEKNK